MTEAEKIRELEIGACLALKQNQLESAERFVQSMFVHARIAREDIEAADGGMIVGSLKNILVFAARNRKEFFLKQWLMEVWRNICLIPVHEELGSFINSVVFVVTDKKIPDVLPKLQMIVKQFLRLARFHHHPLEKFAKEWLGTTAEIASRGFGEGSLFLVQCYLRILYVSDDWQFVNGQLSSYYFHFQVASRRHGYENACRIFGLVHYLEVALWERIGKMPDGVEREMWERRLLRGILNLICNVARVTGRTERDILTTWMRLVTANGGSRFLQRFQNLYSAELCFWKDTRPNSYQALGVD